MHVGACKGILSATQEYDCSSLMKQIVDLVITLFMMFKEDEKLLLKMDGVSLEIEFGTARANLCQKNYLNTKRK